jgi:hypothetical protein
MDMKKKILSVILAVIFVVSVVSTASLAQAEEYEILSSLSTYQKNQETITDSFGMQIKATTFASVAEDSAPVAIYVTNHNGEYPSQATDEECVSYLLDEGYIVVVLDYQDNPLAVSPNIEESVQGIRKNIYSSAKYLAGMSYSKDNTYVIPAGYKIVRDIVYFEMATQSSNEAIKNFLSVWNTEKSSNTSSLQKKLAAAFGSEYAYKTDETDDSGNPYYAITDKVRAETWDKIIMKDGSYMTAEDTQLKLDIIYPAKPVKEAPVAVLAASGTPRNGSTFSTSHIERVHHTGFLFRGYATVCYDHEYMPYMNTAVGGYGHCEPAYTIQGYDGVKTHTAAIRCVKYYADEYGYSKTKIGVFGHSKSSFSSLLSNPTSENLLENSGACAPIGEQPYLTDKNGAPLNADIVCAYHSMGNGSSRYKSYLTSSNVPTIICDGQKDSGNGNSYWEAEKAAYIKSGIEFLAIPMEDQGHTYPVGDDSVYDYNRYLAFCKFFDYYLKDTNPEILYTSVNDGQLKDLITSTTKWGNSNHQKWQIIEGDTLFVQFVAPVTEWSFLEAVSLKDSDGNAVEGYWYTQGGGNKWIFEGDLKEGKTYTLEIADNTAKDKFGRTVEEGTSVTFTK